MYDQESAGAVQRLVPGQVKQAEPSVMQQAQKEAELSLEILGDTLKRLSAKLDPVTVSNNQDGAAAINAGSQERPEPAASSVTYAFRRLAQRANQVRFLIEDLIARVDV